jgi:uncharacterized membrane protein
MGKRIGLHKTRKRSESVAPSIGSSQSRFPLMAESSEAPAEAEVSNIRCPGCRGMPEQYPKYGHYVFTSAHSTWRSRRLFAWGVASLTSSRTDWSALSPRTWLFLAASGLATGLSWLCYFRALQLGEVSKVAPIDKLSVVLALILAAVFLGERMRPIEMLGAGLIVTGALVLVLK